jgi:hypothetical protein
LVDNEKISVEQYRELSALGPRELFFALCKVYRQSQPDYSDEADQEPRENYATSVEGIDWTRDHENMRRLQIPDEAEYLAGTDFSELELLVPPPPPSMSLFFLILFATNLRVVGDDEKEDSDGGGLADLGHLFGDAPENAGPQPMDTDVPEPDNDAPKPAPEVGQPLNFK